MQQGLSKPVSTWEGGNGTAWGAAAHPPHLPPFSCAHTPSSPIAAHHPLGPESLYSRQLPLLTRLSLSLGGPFGYL